MQMMSHAAERVTKHSMATPRFCSVECYKVGPQLTLTERSPATSMRRTTSSCASSKSPCFMVGSLLMPMSVKLRPSCGTLRPWPELRGAGGRGAALCRHPAAPLLASGAGPAPHDVLDMTIDE